MTTTPNHCTHSTVEHTLAKLDRIQDSMDALRRATVAELGIFQDPKAKPKKRLAAARRYSDAEVAFIRSSQEWLSDWSLPISFEGFDADSYIQRTCDAFQNVQY